MRTANVASAKILLMLDLARNPVYILELSQLQLFLQHLGKNDLVDEFLGHFHLKASVREKILFLQTDFLPWEILLIKKLDLKETKST